MPRRPDTHMGQLGSTGLCGLRVHGLSPRVVMDPRLSLFPIRAFLARFKLTYGRRSGAAAPLSRIRRLGSGGRDHSWGRLLRPYARPVRPPGSAGADQAPSDDERRLVSFRSGWLQGGTLHHHAGRRILPQGDQQFTGQGNDQRFPQAPAVALDPLFEPLAEGRVRLVPQPKPGHLHHRSSQPRIARF